MTMLEFKSDITVARNDDDAFGNVTESWLCIDCGVNTAPGILSREQFKQRAEEMGDRWIQGASITQHVTSDSEMYTVRPVIWKKAGMEEFGGCLCVGCIEKRLGRKLKPKDFLKGDTFNHPDMPASERLRNRRKS